LTEWCARQAPNSGVFWRWRKQEFVSPETEKPENCLQIRESLCGHFCSDGFTFPANIPAFKIALISLFIRENNGVRVVWWGFWADKAV